MNEGLPLWAENRYRHWADRVPSLQELSLIGKDITAKCNEFIFFFNKGKDGEEMGTLGYRCSVNSPKKSHSKDAQHI